MTTPHHEDVRPGGWGNRDFRDEVQPARRALERGPTAAILTAVTFLVMLLAIQHENSDCRDACYDGGLRSYERGHAWTAYHDSWQWQAQWALGVGCLVFALAALSTASRYALRRWTTAFNVLAAACAVGWVAWRLLEPSLPT